MKIENNKMSQTIEAFSLEELTNLTSSELLHQVQEAREAAIHLGIRWAEAKRKFKNLKELLPSFLSILQLKKMETEGKSASEARLEIISSEDYQEKVRSIHQQEYEMLVLEVQYKSYLKTLETISSICYVRNSELKLAR